MRQILIATALIFASASAFAEPKCTTAERSTGRTPTSSGPAQGAGLPHQQVQDHQGQLLRIYGFDKDGRKVEIYHDPVSGKAVKSEIHD